MQNSDLRVGLGACQIAVTHDIGTFPALGAVFEILPPVFFCCVVAVPGGGVHMAAAGPPPLSVVHAVPVNYNVPPPVIPLAESAPQFTYMTVAHVVPSSAVPVNMVRYVASIMCCLCY